MKRATVTCAMDYFEVGVMTPEIAEGYACKVAGFDMVVHRVLRYEGGPHPRLWTVTEPTTGRCIFTSITRRDAITGANEAIAKQGGPYAVTREIEKHGPIADAAPDPKAAA